MAEVGPRLGGGVYRLSALRSSHSLSVITGPGAPPVSGAVSESRAKEESARDHPEDQPVSENRAAQHRSEGVSRGRRSQQQHESAPVLCPLSLQLYPSRCVGLVHARPRPPLREKLLPCRMTPWTRGAVSTHPDTFSSHQQHRALCTVIFILAEQDSERPGCAQRLRRAKAKPDPRTATRNYCWRSDRSSKDALLHRSRTAYYDILRVTPGATQSQIKTAYYKQSFVYHPDKNPGDSEASQRFSEVSEAYTVLGNITLRRKYDRGLLSQADIHSAERPSSKETTSRSGPPPQQGHADRARRFSQATGNPRFDFDAFYQGHYGEQLRRERITRAMKERMKEEKKQNLNKWKQGMLLDMTAVMLLALAGLLYVNASQS